MNVDAAAQSIGPESLREYIHRLDSLSGVGADGAKSIQPLADPAQSQCVGSPGVVKRGRGRPRKLVGAVGAGNSRVPSQDAGREPATGWNGWLDEVKEHLDSKDGLTDGQLPVKLAKAVVMRAEVSLMVSPLDVVQALEKCENMALKLKAAKFLKDTSKGTIEELRKYALGLMNQEEDDNATSD